MPFACAASTTAVPIFPATSLTIKAKSLTAALTHKPFERIGVTLRLFDTKEDVTFDAVNDDLWASAGLLRLAAMGGGATTVATVRFVDLQREVWLILHCV